MDERFLNPITASFEILEGYRSLVRQALVTQGLPESSIDQIMRAVQVDRGLYFSLNRRFKLGETGFRQFCAVHGLSPELPELPELARIERLYLHQEEAVLSILEGKTTIVATGTGSGKTEAFLIPILDHCLKHVGERGVKALIVYPMNALANDQCGRIRKALAGTDVTMRLFVGGTEEPERNVIRANPPDILVTNYVMLDRLLTRGADQPIFAVSTESFHYIVLDEIHVYRGNLATHLRFLLARLRERLSHPPLYIGTSATLSQDETDTGGYDTALNDFILPLLKVNDYRLVRPQFEEPADPPAPAQRGQIRPMDRRAFGWQLRVDVPAGLRNLSLLTGQNYSEMDLASSDPSAGFAESRPYRDMAADQVVCRLRRNLLEHGATSFVDLVSLVTTLLPQECPASAAEDLLRSYLSGIAFLNHQAGGECAPLLDFRIHLFLKNVGGFLKRCVHCDTFHTGDQEFCQECGFPLFCVYRDDMRWSVGKVTGGRLRWTLTPESDDGKGAFYVLLAHTKTPPDADDGSLNFSARVGNGQDELTLNYDAYGVLHLKPLPPPRHEAILRSLIPLAPDLRGYAYIHNLVSSILDYEPDGRKKLLAFVDNREATSQFAQLLQDDFASRFFQQYLGLCRPTGRDLNLVAILEILHRKIPDDEQLSPDEKDLFTELDLWYHREVGTPPRFADDEVPTLSLGDAAAYSDLERALLEVFITERAIAWACDDNHAKSRFVRFQKHWAIDHRGIHLRTSEASEHADYPSISLAENAQEHADLVAKYGSESILKTAMGLVDRGLLRSYQTPDGKTHFAISPQQICMRVPAPECRDYEELRQRFLRTAKAHSSEVDAAERQLVESTFQSGALNVVVATPTLELGIDIGQLQNALLIGAPPSPANYAQRAGRAGRGRKGNSALIVTLCSEADEHDAYYFERPALLINGTIAPPSFDARNESVLRKHVNAWMLAGRADTWDAWRQFCSVQDKEIASKLQAVDRVFGEDSGAAGYLRNEFRSALNNQLADETGRSKRSPRECFYANGFFPEYAFRRDEVYLIDRERADTAATHARPLRDIAISQREPELAYRKFAPDEVVFIGGSVYRLTSDGEYETIDVAGKPVMRSYRYMVAEREERLAAREKTLRRFDRYTCFDQVQPFVSKGRVMGIAYSPDCRLLFGNRGELTKEGTRPFPAEGEKEFALGYQVSRDVLLMRFDTTVCADARAYVSLVSGLDRTIKRVYGLDESELCLLPDVRPLRPLPQDAGFAYLAFTDAGGNGNVPMQRAFCDFDRLLEMTSDRLQTCSGSPGHPCAKGCYLCLRSHALRYLASQTDKDSALMFAGYLLGRNAFRPSIEPPKPPEAQPDLVLTVRRQGDDVVVSALSREYRGRVSAGNLNRAIFEQMSKAVQAEFRPTMRSLLVRSPMDYLVDAINRGAVNQGREEFAQLQFGLLRFKNVGADKA